MQSSFPTVVQAQFQEERRREASIHIQTALQLDPQALQPYGVSNCVSDQGVAGDGESQQVVEVQQETYPVPYELKPLWQHCGGNATLIRDIVRVWYNQVLPRIKLSGDNWHVTANNTQIKIKCAYKKIYLGVRHAAKSDDESDLMKSAETLDALWNGSNYKAGKYTDFTSCKIETYGSDNALKNHWIERRLIDKERLKSKKQRTS